MAEQQSMQDISRETAFVREGPEQRQHARAMSIPEQGLGKDTVSELGSEAGKAATDYATKKGVGAEWAAGLGAALNTGVNAIPMILSGLMPNPARMSNVASMNETASHLAYAESVIHRNAGRMQDAIRKRGEASLARTDHGEAADIELKARGHGAGVEKQLWDNRDQQVRDKVTKDIQEHRKYTANEVKTISGMTEKLRNSTPKAMQEYLKSREGVIHTAQLQKVTTKHADSIHKTLSETQREAATEKGRLTKPMAATQDMQQAPAGPAYTLAGGVAGVEQASKQQKESK
jgi:hypothetical protein